VLAMIVATRTALSFTLTVELSGGGPWSGVARKEQTMDR
jgi:hypothetical protein